MKPLNRFLALSALCSLAIALPASSQTSEDRTRGLFRSKRADAMSIVVLKYDKDKFVPVDPSHAFKEGDAIKLAFQSNFTGYVYIVNVTPGGKKCVMFPHAGDTSNAIRSDQRYELPSGRDVMEFDDEKGIEVLQVIMSRQRIAYLDEAVKNEGGCIEESPASAASELATDEKESKAESGGISRVQIAAVLPQSGPGAIRTRDIGLAVGRDKNPEGSVVAISDSEGKGGRLKDGEAAVFELRLKHN